MNIQADIPSARLDVTREQAQRVLNHHCDGSAPISSFEELLDKGFSAFTPTKTYVLLLSDGSAYVLKVSPPSPPASSETYAPNSLSAEHAFLQLLIKQTSVPQPTAHALDTSLTIVPYQYLLLSRPRGVPLSHARTSGALTARQVLLLELRIGAYLKQLHDVQNDWFGLPTQEHDGLYSWQEAFTLSLESLLMDAQTRGVTLAYENVRRYLSRAIGSFLFDDCEVPSLVSFAGDEDTIVVDLEAREGDEVPITSFLSFSHALWGDPLLETILLDPSAALMEGYGGTLIVFTRQKTKRMWYTLFLALMVLVQHAQPTGATGPHYDDKVEWARRTLDKCVDELKDAPCY
ncbi:uncharacterized protein FIBRA_08463 [Fibroporia radiculosa]|uniref:Aminoglycoside phosphotransferase domain-containing protein n=1 Tax=Fibroporia radiculosa TaxID=599839 RepID=J4GHG7_9APHY|nr:uncharacterized protein FIBRA_08463 [Fibroporia radiculosa]CCM06218.1 predicted protein [Fibroporia radiculosa]